MNKNKDNELKEKEPKHCCSVYCPDFPQMPNQILEDFVEKGVRYRKVVRRCGYDGRIIQSWKQVCPKRRDD
jgi:hypothetical protein